MTSFNISIDRGGTFTDVFISDEKRNEYSYKYLSEDPKKYEEATVHAIEEFGKNEGNGNNLSSVRIGTTIATNALLERKGNRFALIVTKGFRDLLLIGHQQRRDLFDLNIKKLKELYEEVIEIDERFIMESSSYKIEFDIFDKLKKNSNERNVLEIKSLDLEECRRELRKLKEKGIRTIAICLLHSYVEDKHEKELKLIGEELEFDNIILSSECMPMIKYVERARTTSIDAYLMILIKNYVERIERTVELLSKQSPVLYMQSNGGLTNANQFRGSNSILSGPAGGYVGYSKSINQHYGNEMSSVGFDMGGTSTDISIFNGKSYEHVLETEHDGIKFYAPELQIKTIAAGGGSLLSYDDCLMKVGPESAGSFPGPVCYRNNGSLAITDANLILGRIQPKYFPHLFGKNRNEPLDVVETRKRMMEMTTLINDDRRKRWKLDESEFEKFSCEKIAHGFVRVANEAMARCIQSLSQSKGVDIRNYHLCAFGGAAGQHVCDVGEILGMKKVFIHRHASILSSFGLSLADIVNEKQLTFQCNLTEENLRKMNETFLKLRNDLLEMMNNYQKDNNSQILLEYFAIIRYEGSDYHIQIKCSEEFYDGKSINIKNSVDFIYNQFVQKHQQQFGFILEDNRLFINDLRSVCHLKTGISDNELNGMKKINLINSNLINAKDVVNCYFDDEIRKVPLYKLEEILEKIPNSDNSMNMMEIAGPSIIVHPFSVIVVKIKWISEIFANGNICLKKKNEKEKDEIKKIRLDNEDKYDPIETSLFSNRFTGIAEEMGRVLQKTSLSTNIKERLDFSCALFNPEGLLVVNAPHIPVHLGAMQSAIEKQMIFFNKNNPLKKGDVILCNDPKLGGSHLPDLTVITPVFIENKIKFYVANRGHHADIGGSTPGSMPAFSTHLFEEGALFSHFKLVDEGKFMEEELKKIFMAPGKFDGCSGTRAYHENLSDLKAQIASNNIGCESLIELCSIYGCDEIIHQMNLIREIGKESVEKFISSWRPPSNQYVVKEDNEILELFGEDMMDDPNIILRLRLFLNKNENRLILDFSETSDQSNKTNLNTPFAIVISAVIYAIRCQLLRDIPLNQGILDRIEIKARSGCLLNPSGDCAVAAGNVLTSQRIVDIIFKLFGCCAASSGCMNNITFGTKNWSYYETVCGGSGATPSAHGTDAVHTHMTNTKITDVEILESRYPVVLLKFCIRKNSGGKGEWNGGNGIERLFLFRSELDISILTERRLNAPWGVSLKSKENNEINGQKGINLIQNIPERLIDDVISIFSTETKDLKEDMKVCPSRFQMKLFPGAIFLLETPGGGSWTN
ncbi:hypothetical protein SNEBB_010636 [Seison nebaliae]|nr:hypothetical protein SNEBB_010636 [Seison nebaliae]